MFTYVAKTEFEIEIVNLKKKIIFEVQNSWRLKYWMFKKTFLAMWNQIQVLKLLKVVCTVYIQHIFSWA